MNLEFLYTICLTAFFYFVFSTGFKFYLTLKKELDFSYVGIIVFWWYASFIIGLHLWTWMIVSFFLAFILAIPFTLIVLFLSNKFSGLYFEIGTLSLYVLLVNIARNLEITGWAVGLVVGNSNIIWEYSMNSPYEYFLFYGFICVLLIIFLTYLRKTLFYKSLYGWWDNELVLKSLGVWVTSYKFFMISLTTFLAVLWGVMYSYYYLYISPELFWLPVLSWILVISLWSFKFYEVGTMLVSLGIVFSYEYMRFAKIVDTAYLWYFREILFAIMIMMVAYFMFRKIDFWREV